MKLWVEKEPQRWQDKGLNYDAVTIDAMISLAVGRYASFERGSRERRWSGIVKQRAAGEKGSTRIRVRDEQDCDRLSSALHPEEVADQDK